MTQIFKRNLLTTASAFAISSAIAFNASAITQSVTANVEFLTPLTIDTVVNAEFGQVEAGVAATEYVLDTAGALTVGTGPGTILGGTTSAASFSIKGSGTQTINISAGGYTANSGVTPSLAVCKYGAGSEVDCNDASLDTAAAPTSGGTTLLMGLTIAATNITDGTNATPSFTMTVVYN